MKKEREVPHSRENAVNFFVNYVAANKASIKGKNVFDLSAGSGFIANAFLEAGADVHLYDLFPQQNIFCPLACGPIDLQKDLPIETSCADVVICAETIEHLPNQYFFFCEAARILKPGGILLFTSPNGSSLRSRFSQFLMESEHYATPAPNELNAFTKWQGGQKGYFGKLFISGALRLRTLAALSGLRIKQIHNTKGSSTSRFLLIFYPLIYYFGKRNLRRQLRNDPSHADVYREIFRINTSLGLLTAKHLILQFVKS